MNKLQLKVLENKPAEVHFNFDEISNYLDSTLNKYQGIIVTEETIKDGKKVIADLRKGKKSLDEFRKKTKKELTKSVTEFENQCKELNRKFDEVINPINQQAEQFEIKRKEEKKIEVEKVIKIVCELKHIEDLPLDEKYLNKSMSLKAIREDLISVANQMLLKQANHKKNISLIEGRIDLANAKYGVTMVKEPYVSMLEHEDIDTILNKILEDGESLKNKIDDTPKLVTPVVQAPKKNEEIFVDTYEIEGTEKQLDMLEDFLNKNNYKWSIK
ncbi:DUF1351 domain-containing protein [Clostridium botulinum]|uniref:DUF1351 domain-containing protein n=1 Tax=Clostridium botulinum TaxID=1491 RepID=UPI0001F84A5A|nr:DUF1351 domain-containing protein [Clostridium botulinum]NFC94367.1 DUF1351 domain-containing protein [Clostridium botulinum]NFD19755.1 DUF1351 domain-containing protein [Clostridium botulinum]NFD25690.1 DUF1351 domain-containing protein [Clostridium botulinum]NFD56090.1 DUF1351 domain-containing protein [Clostridium botulinum]NFE87703.1 DUF1351 domain-containing protein [Clostridium botulinum]